jgi:hypothetical protein
MDERACRGTRTDGTPCRARALPGKAWCWGHDPELADKRQEAYVAGGHSKSHAARAQRLLPTDLKPILSLLVAGMKEVHEGALEPTRLSAMAAAAGAITRLFGLVELEARVAALERDVDGTEHPR